MLALIVISVCLAAAALSLRVKLSDARARLEALEKVGGRERKQLLGELSEIRAVVSAAESDLAEAREKLDVLNPAPSLVGRTLAVTDRDQDLTLRGILHAQHADRWTFRDAVYVTSLGEQPAGGLVHVLVANIGPTQELTEEPRKVSNVTPLRAAEERG